jgi:hypothetical protein
VSKPIINIMSVAVIIMDSKLFVQQCLTSSKTNELANAVLVSIILVKFKHAVAYFYFHTRTYTKWYRKVPGPLLFNCLGERR